VQLSSIGSWTIKKTNLAGHLITYRKQGVIGFRTLFKVSDWSRRDDFVVKSSKEYS
jgi:hypothetical protein